MEEKLGGILGKPGDRALRRHLERCPNCAAEWREQSETQSLLRSWQSPQPPPVMRRRVMEAVHADPFTREHRDFGIGPHRWRRLALECAGAAVLMLIALHLFLGGREPGVVRHRDPGENVYSENYIVELMNDPRMSNLTENERDLLLGTVVAGPVEGRLGRERP